MHLRSVPVRTRRASQKLSWLYKRSSQRFESDDRSHSVSGVYIAGWLSVISKRIESVGKFVSEVSFAVSCG